MFKFVRLLRDQRFWAQVVIVAYQVNVLLSIGTDIATGRAGEVTFYKGISFLWATIALMYLTVNYELWKIIKDIIDDTKGIIKTLQQKNQMDSAIFEIRNTRNKVVN